MADANIYFSKAVKTEMGFPKISNSKGVLLILCKALNKGIVMMTDYN